MIVLLIIMMIVLLIIMMAVAWFPIFNWLWSRCATTWITLVSMKSTSSPPAPTWQVQIRSRRWLSNHGNDMNTVAVLYDNRSVLENHHWRSAIACFIESGLARYLLNLPTYLTYTSPCWHTSPTSHIYLPHIYLTFLTHLECKSHFNSLCQVPSQPTYLTYISHCWHTSLSSHT